MRQQPRKALRLKDYDYGQDGAYFLTICTHGRKHRFGTIQPVVGAGSPGPFVALSSAGEIVHQFITQIGKKYPSVTVADFIIMPDHIHLILTFRTLDHGPGNPAPTLGQVMGWFKYQTTKAINATSSEKLPLWQRGYYEHIIRNEQDYLACAAYVEQNPAAWPEHHKLNPV